MALNLCRIEAERFLIFESGNLLREYESKVIVPFLRKIECGLERMLFRLSRSKYRDTFILKGALLFELWTRERYRATRDADFLAKGDNSPERFVEIFRDISAIEVEDDGLRFDPKTAKAERIKEDADYEGVRVTFTAFLENAQIPIQIDIGFGDAIRPGPVETDYPTSWLSSTGMFLRATVGTSV